MNTLKLMIVDKDMTTIEFEINQLQFKSLGLDLSKVKRHERKRDLNVTITKFIESFNNENE